MSCELETTRLQLRLSQIKDTQILYRLWTNDQIRYFLFDNRIISPDEASVRVLEKLGMRQTGREVVNEHPLLYFEKLRSP
ncbi:MAG: hypothetical protein F6K41_00775 [Symploca sp. SIO3E6]|nr:hypothetical protein [Caldora sp. SIO3E6]